MEFIICSKKEQIMVNRTYAKLYCGEDISLIENYDKANKDLLEVWDLHHRKENEGYSRQELIAMGLYYGRPANELIFLTHAEHVSLHMKGISKSEEHRKKMSEAQKGVKNHMYGKTGEKHPLYGKTGEKSHRSKPINQIDKKTGQVIKTWTCSAEVKRVLGINQGNISACCSGKLKSCGGYIWKYAD